MIASKLETQCLYLDSAKMGQMSETACEASKQILDFAREVGCGSEIGRLIAHGFDAISSARQSQFPSLSCWKGLRGFQRDIKALIGQPQDLDCYTYGEPYRNLRMAYASMFRNSKRVLVTDLIWPPYLSELLKAAKARNVEVVVCTLRPTLTRMKASAIDIRELIISSFQQNRCDGLLISHVTFLGCVMPVAEVISRIRSFSSESFVIVDGAQAIGQIPVNVLELDCDVYLSSTQKWIGSYLPLRMAHVCRFESSDIVRSTYLELNRKDRNKDSLNEFCANAEKSCFKSYGETVSLTQLFAASGAIHDLKSKFGSIAGRLTSLKCNLNRVRPELGHRFHSIYDLDEVCEAGILALDTANETASCSLRLSQNGIYASSFPGTLRLSMPIEPITNSQIELIRNAICN